LEWNHGEGNVPWSLVYCEETSSIASHLLPWLLKRSLSGVHKSHHNNDSLGAPKESLPTALIGLGHPFKRSVASGDAAKHTSSEVLGLWSPVMLQSEEECPHLVVVGVALAVIFFVGSYL
jgi:hypothetical protein